ncbi:MAG: hydroxymethylglutaryl-CoA lyase [Desulfosarcinaceae bacterium]
MSEKHLYPERVFITDVGPRDGLQMEKKVLSTDRKIELIAGLAAAGVPAVQVASFVHPGKVPQMADAEAVIDRLPPNSGVVYSALTLNLKGVERACATAVPWIEVSFSASERQGRDNAGMSVSQAADEAVKMVAMAHGLGRKVRGSIQCCFGCVDACEISVSDVARLARLLLDQGVDVLVLADTTGMAGPGEIRRTLEAVLPLCGATPLCLHLHDTRALGLVNLMAGLEMGVTHFDTSLGGLGGCPFVHGAAGNIATEDTVHLFNRLGVQTGIDIEKVAGCSRGLSESLGHTLSGKLYRLEDPATPDCRRPV